MVSSIPLSRRSTGPRRSKETSTTKGLHHGATYQANRTRLTRNVGMPNLGEKLHLWWLKGILIWNIYINFKNATFIRSTLGSLDCSPKTTNVAFRYGSGSDARSVILGDLFELLCYPPGRCCRHDQGKTILRLCRIVTE
jgi:hypothetical protein